MNDTNWCTFCDCAISPFSDSIYCSEDCFERDALLRDPLYKVYPQQYHTIANDVNNFNNVIVEYTQQARRDSISNSSMCSEDLAAMHMDMILCKPPLKHTPRLSASISSANSQNDTSLRTPPLSYDLPTYEKLPKSFKRISNTAAHTKLFKKM